MPTFLDEVVDKLPMQPSILDSTVIVLPSRRAGAFFRNKLLDKLPRKTVILPEIISIEDLIAKISGLQTGGTSQLLLELYEVYLGDSTIKEHDSFLDFLGWGQTLLGDFNEIDRYLVNTTDFFNYLSAVKEIQEGHWSGYAQSSEMVSGYLSFWKSVAHLYTRFRAHLEQQFLGTQGMLYRRAANNVHDYLREDHKHYIFAGFNALNTAEQILIEAFLDTGNAEIFWDIDTYFLNDKKHIVSSYINSYRKWPYYQNHIFPEGGDNFNSEKSITEVAINQSIGQVKYVGNLLKTLSDDDLENTAIVLSDESLLLPLLNSLPENIKQLNVTMGLPLSEVPDAAFFESWFQLQQNVKEGRLYYRYILALLAQGHTQTILGASTQQLQLKIELENLIYITPDDLIKQCENKETASLLFAIWANDAQRACQSILSVIEALRTKFSPSPSKLNLEFLYRFSELFKQLQSLHKKHNHLSDVNTLHRFYRELLSQETLDFRGDPYKGLQIMGVLETRALDFERVIMTSVNEGVLPSGKSQNSFIPFDLKMEYGLPTYREKDAVYAYHFFRLLQRAKTVHLIYNSEAGGLQSGEKSRFLLQLETDKKARYKYERISVSSSAQVLPTTLRSIQKNEAIILKLREQAHYGFSPSALTTYIRNPLDFYYRYVLGIKEREDVEDTIAYNTLGTVVHQTLEELYTPYLNEVLHPGVMDKIKSGLAKELDVQFDNVYNLSNTKSGKNLIIYNVAKQFVINFLKQETEAIENGDEIIVTNLEEKFTTPLSLDHVDAKLRGTVDRMDQVNGQPRIIDFKTGKVERKHLHVKDWEALTTDYDNYSKAFQVLCYALMYSKEKDTAQEIQAGIVSFKNMGAGFIPLTEGNSNLITPELLQTFEKHLSMLIEEILDIKVPFVEKQI